jgi:hypothetical protein
MGTSAQQLMRQLMQVGGLPPEDEVSPGKVVQNGAIMAQGAVDTAQMAPPPLPSMSPAQMKLQEILASGKNLLDDPPTPYDETYRKRMEEDEKKRNMLLATMGLRKDPTTGEDKLIPIKEEVDEKLKGKYGTKGGTAKKFLLDFLGGMGSAVNPQAGAQISPTAREYQEVTARRKEAQNLYGLTAKSSTDEVSLLKNAETLKSRERVNAYTQMVKGNIAGLTHEDAEAKNQVARTVAEARKLSAQSGVSLNDARRENILAKTANIHTLGAEQSTGPVALAGRATAIDNVMNNDAHPEWADLYKAYQDVPTIWPTEMREAFAEGQKDGQLAWLSAQQKAKVRAGVTGAKNFFRGDIGSTFNKVNGKFVEQNVGAIVQFDPATGQTRTIPINLTGQGGVGNIDTPEAAKERNIALTSISNDLDMSQKAFSLAGQSMDDNLFYGHVMGQPWVKAVAQSFPKIFGLDVNSKNPLARLRAASRIQEAALSTRMWVQKLYEYSGKQINEKEMAAMQQFIPNSLMEKSVFTTLAAANYYTSMINLSRRAQASTAQGDVLADINSQDLSKELQAAIMWSMEKAKSGKPALLDEQQFRRFVDDFRNGKYKKYDMMAEQYRQKRV